MQSTNSRFENAKNEKLSTSKGGMNISDGKKIVSKVKENSDSPKLKSPNDRTELIEEMQKGYLMHDRLLRPSMVYVSKKSKK